MHFVFSILLDVTRFKRTNLRPLEALKYVLGVNVETTYKMEMDRIVRS